LSWRYIIIITSTPIMLPFWWIRILVYLFINIFKYCLEKTK